MSIPLRYLERRDSLAPSCLRNLDILLADVLLVVIVPTWLLRRYHLDGETRRAS